MYNVIMVKALADRLAEVCTTVPLGCASKRVCACCFAGIC